MLREFGPPVSKATPVEKIEKRGRPRIRTAEYWRAYYTRKQRGVLQTRYRSQDSLAGERARVRLTWCGFQQRSTTTGKAHRTSRLPHSPNWNQLQICRYQTPTRKESSRRGVCHPGGEIRESRSQPGLGRPWNKRTQGKPQRDHPISSEQ